MPSRIGLLGTRGEPGEVINTVTRIDIFSIDVYALRTPLEGLRVTVTPEPGRTAEKRTLYRIVRARDRSESFQLLRNCCHSENVTISKCQACDRGRVARGAAPLDRIMHDPEVQAAVKWLVSALEDLNAGGFVEVQADEFRSLQYYVDQSPEPSTAPSRASSSDPEFDLRAFELSNEDFCSWLRELQASMGSPESDGKRAVFPDLQLPGQPAQAAVDSTTPHRSEGGTLRKRKSEAAFSEQTRRRISTSRTSAETSAPSLQHHDALGLGLLDPSMAHAAHAPAPSAGSGESPRSDSRATSPARGRNRPAYWDPVKDSRQTSPEHDGPT